MAIRQRVRFIVWGAALLSIAAASACGKSESTAPTSTPTVTGVALNATSVVVGSTVQATITLSSAASTGGVTVQLSSSNASVATVQAFVTVPPGATTAGITVTTVAPGSATIRVALNGITVTSPTLTVTQAAILASLSLSATTVVGGNPVTGTVTLTGAAPTGGAIVALTGADPVTVPQSVTVAGGLASATFNVATRAVAGVIPATIGASYGGGTASATLSVTPPTVATARFGVTGPNESDTCTLTNGGSTLNCTFNGSTSTAPATIVAWDWSYGVAKTFTQTTSGPVLTNPAVDCSIVPAPPFPAGQTSFTMTVKLKVRDSQGNVSSETVNAGVRLLPQGSCGF